MFQNYLAEFALDATSETPCPFLVHCVLLTIHIMIMSLVAKCFRYWICVPKVCQIVSYLSCCSVCPEICQEHILILILTRESWEIILFHLNSSGLLVWHVLLNGYYIHYKDWKRANWKKEQWWDHCINV